MKTYTFGTTPLEVIETALPHKYSMELNKSDMLHLLSVLMLHYSFAEPSGDVEDDELDWCSSMRTNILYTIGIEEV